MKTLVDATKLIEDGLHSLIGVESSDDIFEIKGKVKSAVVDILSGKIMIEKAEKEIAENDKENDKQLRRFRHEVSAIKDNLIDTAGMYDHDYEAGGYLEYTIEKVEDLEKELEN